MYLSAAISFSVGIILIVAGIVSVFRCKKIYQLMFAAIPIIFGSQQIIEGFLWIFLQHRAYDPIKQDLTYLYLFLAEVIWPVWIPLSILQLEKNNTLKLVQTLLVSLGIFVSGYLAFCILTFNVNAVIVNSHIHYTQHYLSPYAVLKSIPYLLTAIIPFFFSGFRKMWIIGLGLTASFVLANIFYTEFLISVWCLFAGLVSLLVYPVIRDVNKMEKS